MESSSYDNSLYDVLSPDDIYTIVDADPAEGVGAAGRGGGSRSNSRMGMELEWKQQRNALRMLKQQVYGSCGEGGGDGNAQQESPALLPYEQLHQDVQDTKYQRKMLEHVLLLSGANRAPNKYNKSKFLTVAFVLCAWICIMAMFIWGAYTYARASADSTGMGVSKKMMTELPDAMGTLQYRGLHTGVVENVENVSKMDVPPPMDTEEGSELLLAPISPAFQTLLQLPELSQYDDISVCSHDQQVDTHMCEIPSFVESIGSWEVEEAKGFRSPGSSFPLSYRCRFFSFVYKTLAYIYK